MLLDRGALVRPPLFPCGKWPVPVQDERVLRGSTRAGDERLTSRLEAFGDLVFGFSLSLLALRLDVPSRVEDIFEPTRWLTVILTFAFICRFWLEHYRIFRHHFAVRTFDMVVNFVFLFGIAILPYAVQTFLRFKMLLLPFSLYLGDLILVLTTHAICGCGVSGNAAPIQTKWAGCAIGNARWRSSQERRGQPVSWRQCIGRAPISKPICGSLAATRFPASSCLFSWFVA